MGAELYWEEQWRTGEGETLWSAADPWVLRVLEDVKDRSDLNDGRPSRALDLGCGLGRHLLPMASLGFESYGLDASSASVAYSQEAAIRSGVEVSLEVGRFHPLPYPDDYFDYILAYNAVYHGDEPALERTLFEIARVSTAVSIFQTTMLSKRNDQYGRGVEVSANTFIQPDALDDKKYEHLYVDEDDLARLHKGFQTLEITEVEHDKPGSFHWHCVFQQRGGEL